MKPTKFLIGITSLCVVLIFIGLFLPWMFGNPTGKTTEIQKGNSISILVELEKISGWQIISSSLSPECFSGSAGVISSVRLLLIPAVSILTLILVLIPWRKRKLFKRDGFILIAMAILLIIGLGFGRPSCPKEITSHWSYGNGPTDGLIIELIGLIFILTSAVIILFKRFPKFDPDLPQAIIEYRICRKCMTSVDKRESICPNCSNRME
jgi:hypothetical protein